MNKSEIINLIESNEVFYLKALMDQVKDNMEELVELTEKDYPASVLKSELNRLGERNVQLLNLSDELISTMNDSKEKAVKRLYRLEEGM